MASIRVVHNIGDLADDCASIVKKVRPDMTRVVRKNVHDGMIMARANARRTAGKHGKHYPRSITEEMKLFGGLGLIAGEYGPDEALRQGGMSFEGGSRNQPPHLDLFKSSLKIGGPFVRDVDRAVGGWFW